MAQRQDLAALAELYALEDAFLAAKQAHFDDPDNAKKKSAFQSAQADFAATRRALRELDPERNPTTED